MKYNEFKLKFKLDEMLIHESDFWIWSLRPDQPTLGSSILSLKRELHKISDLTEEEQLDYRRIIKVIEGTLSLAFDYERINHLMLMMVDKQVHYHVIPRYQKEVYFNDSNWKDYGWPSLPNLDMNNENDSFLELIKFLTIKKEEYLKNNYKVGYTTGVYDLFHVGHLNLLKKAKEQCDYLIVGVTTDELVSYKNAKAVINLEDRMTIVSGTKYADKVVVQDNMNKMEAWKKYKFDLMFVGSDWQGTETWNKFEEEFKEVGVEIRYIPYTQRISSTMLRETLKNKNK